MAKAETQQLLDGGYYAGDWIPQPFPALQREQQQTLLDGHPLFTGRCPECETPIPADPPRREWYCDHCGWQADSSEVPPK